MSNKKLLISIKYKDDDDDDGYSICDYYTDFTFKEEYPYSDNEHMVYGKWKMDECGKVWYMTNFGREEWILDICGEQIINYITEQELLKEE